MNDPKEALFARTGLLLFLLACGFAGDVLANNGLRNASRPDEAPERASRMGGLDLDLYVTLDGRTATRLDFDGKSTSRGPDEEIVGNCSFGQGGTCNFGGDELNIAVQTVAGTGSYKVTVVELLESGEKETTTYPQSGYREAPVFGSRDNISHTTEGPDAVAEVNIRLDGVADGAPSPPTNLTAEAENDGVSLSWTAPDASDLSAYKIYRQQEPFEEGSGTAGLVSYDQVDAGQTTFLDGEVDDGTTYYYRVAAVDEASCESSLSNTVSATASGGEINFVVEQGEETYSVSPLSEGSSAGDFYNYESSKANPPSTINGEEVDLRENNVSHIFLYEGPSGTISLFVIHGFANGRTTFSIENYPSSFTIGLIDDPSDESKDPYDPPGVVTWGWNDSKTDGAVWEGGLGDAFSLSINPSFEEGVQDWVLVRPKEREGVQKISLDLSESITITRSEGGDENSPPDRPTGLAASVGLQGGIQLTWESSGAEDLAKYRLYRDTSSIDQGTDPSTLTPLDSTEAGTTTFLDEDVMEGTTYYYRITAVDDAGNESPLSAEQATATPGKTVLVTGLEPSSGAPGTVVRITGTGFTKEDSDQLVPPSVVDSVTIGDARATVQSVAPGEIQAEVPSSPSGPTDVTVTAGGVSAAAPSPFSVLTGGAVAFSDAGPGVQGAKLSSSDWGDFDGDGDLDLIVAGEDSSGMAVTQLYRNDGSGDLSRVQGTGFVGVRNGALDWGDYNGDGRPDLILTGRSESEDRVAKIYRNEGGGSFSEIGAGLPGVLFSAAGWGDADGDGDLDLAITGDAGPQGRISRIYENKGGGDFQRIGANLRGVAFGSVAWGNYDEVGTSQQLLITGSTSEENVTILYEGPPNFDIDRELVGVSNGDATWGDLGNDGDLDLAIIGTSEEGRIAKVYRADSTQSGVNLVEMNAGLEGVSGGSVQWGDFDGDGDLDLVVAGERPTANGQKTEAVAYRNEEGSFMPVSAGLAGASLSSVSVGDANGDGILDLVLTGYDGGATARIYQGQESAESAGLSARSTDQASSGEAVPFGGTEVEISFSEVGNSGPVSVATYERAPGKAGSGIDQPVVQEGSFVLRASDRLSFESARVKLPRATGRGLSRHELTVYWRPVPGQGEYVPLSQSPEVAPEMVAFTTDQLGEFALASSERGPLARIQAISAEPKEEGVRLTWKSASPAPKVRFEILRRAESLPVSARWQEVASTPGREEKTTYKVSDTDIPFAADSLMYRIRQIGPGGQTSRTRTVSAERRSPNEAALKTVYPNPARREVTVQYAVPVKQTVALRVFDLLGRRVRSVKVQVEAGRHEQSLNVSPLTSGTYFLRFAAKSGRETQKITVVR